MNSLSFTEEMKGWVALGEVDHAEGYRKGKAAGTSFMFHLTIEVDDVDAFAADPRHEAVARGWVDCDALGGRLAVERGVFNLFVDADVPGRTHMLYRLFFDDAEGHPLTMSGFKVVQDDPGRDLWPDTSTLYVRVLAGHVEEAGDGEATVVAAGRIRIHLLDFAHQLTTFRVKGPTPAERARALHAFGRLFLGRLWDTYAPPARAAGKELRHELIIDAPVGMVWDELVDTAGWPAWNPTLLRSSGPLVAGTDVKMRLQLGPARLPMRQRIEAVDPPRLLRWVTRQIPGVFEVERSFELTPLAGDRTHLAQYEVGATWLAAKLVPVLERSIEDGYVNLARALAARVTARREA